MLREIVIFLTLCNPLGRNKIVDFFEAINYCNCIGGGNRIRTGVKRFCRPLP